MKANTTMTRSPSGPQAAATVSSRVPAAASQKVQERIEREARARRTLFIVSIMGLAATLGIVAISAGSPQAAQTALPVAVSAPAAPRIVAEVPIQAADGQSVQTIVRVVTTGQDAPAPDVRSRAS